MSRPALLALVVVVAFALAGCSVLDPDPTREDEAVQVLENATAAAEDVETYEYESDVSATDGTDRIHVSMVGTVDVAGEATNATVTHQGEAYESYRIGNVNYQECPDPWGGWGTETVEAEEDWLTGTPLGSQLTLLESGDLSYEGIETVDGRETIHLVGSPPPSAFDDDADPSPLGLGGPGIDDATVEMWIDAETDLPVKTSMEIEVSDRGGSATSSITTRFSAYDEAGSVELPPEVTENVRETGCPGSAP